MRIIVADTGPLNDLVLIGEIDLLPKLFDGVLAPQTVIDELTDPDTCAGVRVSGVSTSITVSTQPPPRHHLH